MQVARSILFTFKVKFLFILQNTSSWLSSPDQIQIAVLQLFSKVWSFNSFSFLYNDYTLLCAFYL